MTRRLAVLVTGSNGGIGRKLCDAFHTSGYLVVATDLDEREAPQTVDLFLPLDLCDLVNDATARERFKAQIGDFTERSDAQLKVLVNNAAVQITGSLEAVSVQDFELSYRVNVTAPFVLTKSFANELRGSRGRVLNIGSIHSRLTKPDFCCYSTTKAALAGLTRALALEFAGNVTVNTILPAAIDTPMLSAGFREAPDKQASLAAHHPVGRIGTTGEVAELALYLASSQAEFITGAEFAIDGGIGVRLHDPV